MRTKNFHGTIKQNGKQITMSKKIGIIGCGVIGTVLKDWLRANTRHIVKIQDPAKGYLDNIDDCDVYFIQIHIPTERNGKQNLKKLEKIIVELPNKPIFIRTTLLPGTTNKLRAKFHKDIYFMPEFLTERTARKDFNQQHMVFTGRKNLLKTIFPNKPFIQMSSTEAEIAKYAHNVFGALKVTYFNAVYECCSKFNVDFQKVRKGVVLSKYISPVHTMVPGPDGSFGYGGKCFPKDVHAFYVQNKRESLGYLLKKVVKLNKKFRRKTV